jgi:hypothetical protein
MKYKIIATLFISCSLLLVSGCSDENDSTIVIPSVSSSLLTVKPITIGDPIDIALTIYHDKNSEVVFPKKSDSFLPFTLRTMDIRQNKIKGKSYKTTVFYTITLFQTGKYILHPIEVRAGDNTLKTEPIEISILSVIPKNEDNPDLKDIVPPYPARVNPLTVAIILLAIMGATAIIYILLRIFKKKKGKKQGLTYTETKIDPFQYSMNELNSLKTAYKNNEKNVKQTYSVVSFILKFFLGNILKIDALQMTTREFRRHVRKADRVPIPSVRVMNILKTSDMVKFAKEKLSGENVTKDIQDSISIIKEVHESGAQPAGSSGPTEEENTQQS